MVDFDLEDLPVEQTLGVQWDMETDDFKFRIMDKGKAPTRRGVLSVVSSMYDLWGSLHPLSCQPKACRRACVSRNIAGTKRFRMQIPLSGKVG